MARGQAAGARHPDDDRSGHRPPVVRDLRGGRPGRHHRQAADDHVRARASDSCTRSNTPVRPTAWWPASGTTSPGRWSARCCSGLFDDEGALHHVGVSASLLGGPPQGAAGGARALPGAARPRTIRGWAGWKGSPRPRQSGPATAGRGEPVDRQEGSQLGAAARRSWWSRSATTPWRATGSGTPPSSSGGGPTATPGLVHLRAARAAGAVRRRRRAGGQPVTLAAHPAPRR